MPRIRQRAEIYANEDLCKELCGRMGYLGLSQRDLAQATGISQSTISNRIRNPNSITLCELRTLVRALKPDPATVLASLGYSHKDIKKALDKKEEAT